MSEKNLLEGHFGPVTQSIEAVKALLTWKGHPVNPLPADVSVDNGRLVLVLSNKKDAYYTVTARACSCPGNQFRHSCKHIRKYFPQEQTVATKPVTTDNLIERGGFKPFDELPGEERAENISSSSLSAIDCHDTTALDVAYHSIREDKILWPLEA
jgi:hypothetical protein